MFDAYKDGQLVEPNVANLMIPVVMHQTLEQDSPILLEVEIFDSPRRREVIQLDTLHSQTIFHKELLNKGYMISYKYVNHLRHFLTDYLRKSNNAIQKVFEHKHLGFYEEQGKLHFLLDKNTLSKGISTFRKNGTIEFQSGSEEANLKFIKEEIIPYQATQLALVLGLNSVIASRLQNTIDGQVIVVNFCGESSTGKTTMAKFIASLWGKPEISNSGIVKTFSNTHNARTASIEGYNGFPIIFDDINTASYVNRPELIYQISEGEPRARMTNYGQEIKQGASWSGQAIITSETPLLKDTEHRQGLLARVIDTKNTVWTKDHEHAKRISEHIFENYGHVGRKFVSNFLQESEDTLKQIFKDSRKAIDERITKKDNLTDRILNKYATILSTAKLVNQYLDFTVDTESILQYLVDIEEESTEDRHIGLKALGYIKDYIQRNGHKFIHYSKATKSKTSSAKNETIGTFKINDKTVEVYILSSVVQEILANHKLFEYKPVLKFWNEKGYIKPQSNKNTVNIKALKTRAVHFVFEREKDTLIEEWLDVDFLREEKDTSNENVSHDYRELVLKSQEPEHYNSGISEVPDSKIWGTDDED